MRLCTTLLLLAGLAAAQVIPGGAPSSNGRTPQVRYEPPTATDPGAFVVDDAPTSDRPIELFLSRGLVDRRPPGVRGRLRVDVFDDAKVELVMHQPRLPIPDLFVDLEGKELIAQAVCPDGEEAVFSDALRFTFHNHPARLAEYRPRPSGSWEDIDHAPLSRDRVLVIAHRGRVDDAPGSENTLAGIERAFDAGADAVEVDVRKSSDGTAVLMHDWTLDRTTRAAGFVQDYDAEALAELGVPTLADALRTAKGRGPLLLDTKTWPIGAAIAQALEDVSADRDAAWLWPADVDLALAAQHAPLLAGQATDDPQELTALRNRGVIGFDLAWGSFDADFVARAHAHDLAVFTYTLNDPDQWRQALALGVDGIETDRPLELREFLVDPSPPLDVPWPIILGGLLGSLVGLFFLRKLSA